MTCILLCLALLLPMAAVFKIQRNAHSRSEFKHQQPYPTNGKSKGSCKGYVINHVVPLACGGADAASNM